MDTIWDKIVLNDLWTKGDAPWKRWSAIRDMIDEFESHIPVYRPYLGDDVQKAAIDALAAGWLGMGKLSEEFEASVERYLGLRDRRVVSTNSCTEALHLAGRLIGLGPGDEVICPAFTYVAGHQAISRTGADIVFCDVEPRYLSIDPNEIRKLITPRTRALLAVESRIALLP